VKSSSRAASATSLPRAPRDDAGARSKRYLIMMGIRTLCFILMVVITPYGWYTWVLGAAALFLPYIAVVTANVSQNVRPTGPENPERALPAVPHVDDTHPASPPTVRIEEIRAAGDGEQPDEQA
jgi:hypothetical protein